MKVMKKMVKLVILAVIFVFCVGYGVVKGNQSKRFMGPVVIWFIKTPIWTTSALFLTFLILYGFKWQIFLTLIPLISPILIHFSEFLYGWQRVMVEKKFYPQIKEMVKEVVPFYKDVDVDILLMHKWAKSGFLPQNPKDLGARVYLEGKTEEAKAHLEEYESKLGDKLSNFFYQAILTIR